MFYTGSPPTQIFGQDHGPGDVATGRSEAVEHRQLGMVQIRETKYGPTIVSFCFSVSHAGGLQIRNMGLGHRMGCARNLVYAVSRLGAVVVGEIA